MGIVDSTPCEQSLLRSSSISREEEGDCAHLRHFVLSMR